MAERYVTVLDSDKRTPEMKLWARANDKKVHKLLMKRVTTVTANNVCADCDSKRPGWAALPHGVHVCINCAQIHRRIGRHISQVKAINTGTYLWHRDEVDCMLAMGNENAARLLRHGGNGRPAAPRKPSKLDSVEKKEAYIRDVYEHHKYLNASFSLTKQGNKKHQATNQPCRNEHKDELVKRLSVGSAPQLVFQQQQAQYSPVIKKQPALYEFGTNSQNCSGSGGREVDEVDFFSLFDMKATTTLSAGAAVSSASAHSTTTMGVAQTQLQAAAPAAVVDFSDIMALYRD